MLLAAYLQTVYLPSRITVSARYAMAMRSLVALLSIHLGRPAKVDDLSETTIAAFLSSVAQDYSAASVNSFRNRLLALARDGYERGVMPRPPRAKTIRKLREDTEPPRCWRKQEIRRLVAYIQTLPGTVGDVPASLWWLSLVLSIHWTSSRIGSMLAVRSEDYDGRGLLVRQQKNKRPQWFPLPRSCRAIIEATDPHSRKLVWQSPWCPRHVWTLFRSIIEAAGLPCPRTGRNLFHRLRRTTITYCALADPAIAQRTAGHRDYATTLRSYVDQTIVRMPSAMDVLFNPLVGPHHATQRLRIIG